MEHDPGFADCCQAFAESYELSNAPAMLELEQSVLGCNYGATSWTTRAQAAEIVGALGLGPGVQLLEVGAGSGWPGLYLAELSGCDVTLVDLPVSALEKARRRAMRDGSADRVTAVSGSGESLPFCDSTFSAISHSDVLCCLPGKIRMLNECRRVAKVGAAMLFSVISVPRSLDSETRRKALEVGPPFVDSGESYPEMLPSTGWRVVNVRDVTSEYGESLRTLVAGLKESRALEAVLGRDGVAESIHHRQSQIAAIEQGALVREVFLVTAV